MQDIAPIIAARSEICTAPNGRIEPLFLYKVKPTTCTYKKVETLFSRFLPFPGAMRRFLHFCVFSFSRGFFPENPVLRCPPPFFYRCEKGPFLGFQATGFSGGFFPIFSSFAVPTSIIFTSKNPNFAHF